MRFGALLIFVSGMLTLHGEQPKPVENAATAVFVAVPALVEKFGEAEVARQRPFHVRLAGNSKEGEQWIVEGRRGDFRQCGGVVCVRIRKKDGRIIEIFIWK